MAERCQIVVWQDRTRWHRKKELAREGDIVVCTGKGSEEWIHVENGKKISWDEKKTVEEALARR